MKQLEKAATQPLAPDEPLSVTSPTFRSASNPSLSLYSSTPPSTSPPGVGPAKRSGNFLFFTFVVIINLTLFVRKKTNNVWC